MTTSKQNSTEPKEHNPALSCYDAGLLNDYGGGNVEWWQDYIRAELARAHEFYLEQYEGIRSDTDLRAALAECVAALKQCAFVELDNEPKKNRYACPHCYRGTREGRISEAMERIEHKPECPVGAALTRATTRKPTFLTTMTTSKQNSITDAKALVALPDDRLDVMLAELCGYRWIEYNGRLCLWHSDFWKANKNLAPVDPKTLPELERSAVVPRYTRSLDACAEVERGLTEDQHNMFRRHLAKTTGVGHLLGKSMLLSHRKLTSAEPKPRTIALILTLTK